MRNKKVMEINYPQDLLDAVNSNIRKISFLLLGLAAASIPIHIFRTKKGRRINPQLAPTSFMV